MLKKYVLITATVLLSTMLFAQADENWFLGKPIKAIDFQGLSVISRMDLDEIFADYHGKTFSNDLYLEILEKLYSLEYFKDIQINALPYDPDYQSVRLEFTVSELPAISGLIFEGNNNIRSGELLSKIILKKGSIYNEINNRMDEESLRHMYLEKGYATVRVSSKAVPNTTDNTVTLQFFITEGKQTVVAKILFKGNKKASNKQLKKVLVTKEPRLLTSGIFKKEALDNDKEAIKELYGSMGYIDAHVEKIDTFIDKDTNPEKEMVTLTYTIMEGECFNYVGTTFVGNNLFSSEELQSKIRLSENQPVNMTKFKIGHQSIYNTYFESGYLSNLIRVQQNRDDVAKTIGFVMHIEEHPRSHVENIHIKGNNKTLDSVILRELLLKQGDVFSKTKYDDSLRNLYNLRYFSSIVPEVKPGSAPDLLDITLNVEEQSTAKIACGLSFAGIGDANGFPLSLFLEWEESNLRGRGSGLRVKGAAGADEQSATLGYTENWFLGLPVSVGFDFSVAHNRKYAFQDIAYPFFDDGVPDGMENGLDPVDRMRYNRLNLSFGVNTAYRWFPAHAIITLRGGLNFSVVKNFYDVDLYRPASSTTRNEQKRLSLRNMLWSRISFDGRDIAHDPGQGWFVSEELAFVGLLPKLENEYYFKSDLKTEGYIKLLDYPVSEVWNLKFVLAFYNAFTFQVPLSKKQIGAEDQLRVDGMFIGRGWNMLSGGAGQGNIMLNHSVEFRWPLAHGILSFDFFFDAVAVKKDFKDLKSFGIQDYYFSFGPGLRFSLPQFPLRLMFANTFRSDGNWKPHWGNGKKADWRFVLSFTLTNL